jgi:large subunit ribosomal protein L7/L12
MATMTKEEFLTMIEGLTVLELNEYVKALEDKFGVTAAPPAVAVAAAPGAAAPAAEEKTEFDVILTDFADKKIQVIKVIREITGLGLKEAKDLVEGVPKPVKEGSRRDEEEDRRGGGQGGNQVVTVLPADGRGGRDSPPDPKPFASTTGVRTWRIWNTGT